MSDISVCIMDRVYRLAVADNQEDKLRDCAAELDRRMRQIRSNGRVLGYDQIAVMVALDLLWSDADKNAAAQEQQRRESEDSSRVEQMMAKAKAALVQNLSEPEISENTD